MYYKVIKKKSENFFVALTGPARASSLEGMPVHMEAGINLTVYLLSEFPNTLGSGQLAKFENKYAMG